MFQEIPEEMAARMRELVEMDARDRAQELPLLQRLRQVPEVTGRFIALVASLAPAGRWIEIGTSAGYSGLWLALACREAGAKLTTFEILEEKAALARETFAKAQVTDVVDFVQGDALQHLEACSEIGFCFLDAEKEIYGGCYEMVVPRLVPGGILLADNALSHQADLQPMLDRAFSDRRMEAVVAPVGTGVLLARKKGSVSAD